MEETNKVGNLIESLKQANTSEWVTGLKKVAWDHAPGVVAAIVILIVGLWLAKLARRLISGLLTRRELDPIVAAFISSLAHIGLMAFVVIAALQKLGIPTTSFVAVIGAAGLAIGLALQSSLSNFAAGFLLIIFRPFTKGDYIEAGGTAGLVEEIQVFTTVLKTPDNKKVIVPNSGIMGGNITNYSALTTRRVDWVFGVSYNDDLDKVRASLQRVISADRRIHLDPPPIIAVNALADSSVNFAVRAWVDAAEYWDVFFAINESVKKTFDSEGITIPFPQREMHVYNHNL
jgi:small conductance mechanosensitive channel